MMRTRRLQREVAVRWQLAVLVEAAVGLIHSAVLGLLVGHTTVEAALGLTVLTVLVETVVGPIHSAALVKTALGPTVLSALVEAAVGPIHSRDGGRPDPRRGAPPLALARLASRASVWTPPR